MYRHIACLHHSLGAVRWRSTMSPGPLLTATPARALVDEQVAIQGHFLPRHTPVTVSARMHSEDGELWEAFSHYNTHDNGTVNLTRDHSIGGSYLGCEPMGLFWGLQPRKQGLRLRKRNVRTPFSVHLSLLEGHVTPGGDELEAEQLSSATVERWYMAPGVRRLDIRENGVVGTLFLPPGPGPFPAMIDLWGMGRGLYEYRAALFASRGFASLALVYYGHEDLPGPNNQINVGDSYFKSAYSLLQDHPDICGDRIGINALSFGVYFALRIATHLGVSPKCVIAVNGPMGSNNKLYDTDGTYESFERDMKHWRYDEEGSVILKDMALPANIPPQRRVKIEELSSPLLYIAGEDDQCCSSVENAKQIEEILTAAGKGDLFTCVSYPGAGHLIEPPYTPNSRASWWATETKQLVTLWGGHSTPHAAAQEDAWKKTLGFMESNLRG